MLPVSDYLEDTTLSTKTLNLLRREGYKLVRDINGITMSDLKRIPQFGKLTIADLCAALAPYGIIIHEDDNPLKINHMARLVRQGYLPHEIEDKTRAKWHHVMEAWDICRTYGIGKLA